MTNFNPSNFSCGTLMRSRSQMPLLSRQGISADFNFRGFSRTPTCYTASRLYRKNIFTGLAPFTKFSYKLATPKMRNFKPLSVAKTPHWIEIQSAPESPPSHDRLRNEIQRAIQEAEYFHRSVMYIAEHPTSAAGLLEQHGFTLIAFESASEQNTHGRSYWLRKNVAKEYQHRALP
jgi:hypothetical protein